MSVTFFIWTGSFLVSSSLDLISWIAKFSLSEAFITGANTSGYQKSHTNVSVHSSCQAFAYLVISHLQRDYSVKFRKLYRCERAKDCFPFNFVIDNVLVFKFLFKGYLVFIDYANGWTCIHSSALRFSLSMRWKRLSEIWTVI